MGGEGVVGVGGRGEGGTGEEQGRGHNGSEARKVGYTGKGAEKRVPEVVGQRYRKMKSQGDEKQW